MPTTPEPAPLRPMTLGDDGAVQFEIDGRPQPLTGLTINGVDVDPHHVIAPMTAALAPGGRVELAMRWLVDDVRFTTADGKSWHLSRDGRFTAAGGQVEVDGR